MAEYIERETARTKLILNDELHAADLIKSIPAADVRPVVRGEWTKSEYDGSYHVFYMCSQCGNPIGCDKGKPRENGLNFCPSCRALMEDSKPPKEE